MLGTKDLRGARRPAALRRRAHRDAGRLVGPRLWARTRLRRRRDRDRGGQIDQALRAAEHADDRGGSGARFYNPDDALDDFADDALFQAPSGDVEPAGPAVLRVNVLGPVGFRWLVVPKRKVLNELACYGARSAVRSSEPTRGERRRRGRTQCPLPALLHV